MSLVNIEAFYANRDFLIDALEAGKIDKTEYFEESLKFLKDIGFKPQEVSTLDFDGAAMHYQYFNLMAKYHFMQGELKVFNQPKEAARQQDLGFDFYTKKDQVTLRFLELSEYKDIRAYYIALQSKALEGQLFEIIFEKENRIVLHSKDKRILYKLKDAGVFDERLQPSAIDEYVNTRYK